MEQVSQQNTEEAPSLSQVLVRLGSAHLAALFMEIIASGKKLFSGVLLIVIALALLIPASVILSFAILLKFKEMYPGISEVASYALVAGLWAVLAVAFLFAGRSILQRTTLFPENALKSIEETIACIKVM